MSVTLPPKVTPDDTRPVKGCEYFNEAYCNIFLCAPPKSGKTTIIYNILKNCIGKNTKVLIFASTFFRDPTYAAIKQMLEKKKIPYQAHLDLVDDTGINVLNAFVQAISQPKALEPEPEPEPTPPRRITYMRLEGMPPVIQPELPKKPKKQKKPKKEKYLAPEYVIIMDDLGENLKDRCVYNLLKMHRHYNAKVIISSQWLKDLMRRSILQLNYVLAFRQMSKENLEYLKTELDLPIEQEHFNKMYYYATDKPYGFLYIDKNEVKFRSNFKTKLN